MGLRESWPTDLFFILIFIILREFYELVATRRKTIYKINPADGLYIDGVPIY